MIMNMARLRVVAHLGIGMHLKLLSKGNTTTFETAFECVLHYVNIVFLL